MRLFQEKLKAFSDNQKRFEIWQKNLHRNVFGIQSTSECPFLGSTWIFNKNLDVFVPKALLGEKKKVYENSERDLKVQVKSPSNIQ